jgi:hypothetical protein
MVFFDIGARGSTPEAKKQRKFYRVVREFRCPRAKIIVASTVIDRFVAMTSRSQSRRDVQGHSATEREDRRAVHRRPTGHNDSVIADRADDADFAEWSSLTLAREARPPKPKNKV